MTMSERKQMALPTRARAALLLPGVPSTLTPPGSQLAARDRVYAWARRQLVDSVGPQLTTYPAAYASRVKLDNAALLARRVYMTDLAGFDAIWEREGRDLRRTISRVIEEHRASR